MSKQAPIPVQVAEIVSALRKGVPVHFHGVEPRLNPLEWLRVQRLMEDAADLIEALLMQFNEIEDKFDDLMDKIIVLQAAVAEAVRRRELQMNGGIRHEDP